MRKLGWVEWTLLIVLLLAFLVIRLPASLLGAVLASETNGQLRFAAVSGTVWHGSGQPLLDGTALGEQLQWDWLPTELLHGRLGYTLQMDGGSAKLAARPGDIVLLDTNLSLPAAPLLALDNRTKGYALTGQLRVASPSLRWHNNAAEGGLTLDWQGAGTGLAPSVDPLGDYRLALMPIGKAWQLQLTTLSGRLTLNGGGMLSAADGLKMNLSLKAAQGSEAALSPFLSRIGPGAPDAERQLSFSSH